MPTKLISDLPAGPTPLVGTELVEIQNGSSVGASQQSTAAEIAQIALRQSVQAITAGTAGMSIDDTDPNAPVIHVPIYHAGSGGIAIDESNPAAPVINIPSDGGIAIAYGSPGGAVLTTAQAISGFATSGYNLTGWKIQCSPSGSITVDIRVGSLGSTPATIIGTGNAPSVASATSNSANTLTGWNTTTIAQGSVIEAIITAVANVEWYNIALLGTRT